MSRRYYDLVASLPRLPATLAAPRLPITEARLRERFCFLHPDDRALAERLLAFLERERSPVATDDAAILARYDAFLGEPGVPRYLRDLIRRRLERLTILMALRRRKRGLEPPERGAPVLAHIRRHWRHPDFRLASAHPWLPRIVELHDKGLATKLEEVRLEFVWTDLARRAESRLFTMEWFVLYLLRWEILLRRLGFDEREGRARFERLVEEAMGSHADLFG